MTQWQLYNEKFSKTSKREQYLTIATGLVAIVFILFSLFLDEPLQRTTKLKQEISNTKQSNQRNISSIQLLEQALREDPNVALKKELTQYQTKLAEVDQQLLELTSDLIDPIQMRYALIKLLKLQKGVKLLSFEVLPAQAVTKDKPENNEDKNNNKLSKSKSEENEPAQLHLYRHGVKIKLQGHYFQLKNYLVQLEDLSWRFFWQEFDYQLKEYPVSELEVEIYSLSTAQEFIGV
jgi:MSHA biogenesis protein MshJ